MHLLVYALLFLYQSFAIATPLANKNGENLVLHLSNERLPRNIPYGGLAELDKRVTTVPDLVPTTTVHLGTDSTATTQIVSPNRAGQTTSTNEVTSTGETTSTNAFAVPTGHSASSVTVATAANSSTKVMGQHRATATSSSMTAAQSTSSKGGASSSNTVPLAGILLLGLLGL